jgi:hypothetical protein
MADEGRCRMHLKRGGQCKNRAISKGLCGVHRRATKQRRTTLQILLTTGQYVRAIEGLVELLKELGPVFHHAEQLLRGHHFVASKKVAVRSPRQQLSTIARTRNYSHLPRVSRVLLKEVDRLL